jgi:hypothetical protein
MTPEETLKVKSLTDRSDIFNYVVDHLRKQGTRSLSRAEDNCAYRGDGGTMCAVGCLMTDDEYHPSCEGNSIVFLLWETTLAPSLKERVEPNFSMLMDLQNFHDDYLEYLDGAFAETSEFHINELREKWVIK